MRWAVVVPVKRLERAKSRLDLAPQWRQELALAMAHDVVVASLGCASVVRVVVVTDDERAGAELAALGADLVPDQPDAGLNPALVHGSALARAVSPDAGLVVLSSDIPGVLAVELGELLEAAASHPRWFVRDRVGAGTTALGCQPAVPLTPHFGPASARAHAESGHGEPPAASSLRHDVDSTADLAQLLDASPAQAAPRTRAVAATAGLALTGLRR